MSDRRFVRITLAIVVVSVAARLAVVVPRIGREADDPDHYLTLAKSISEGRGFTLSKTPTAYRPPLYPILLAPLIVHLDPIRVFPKIWGPLGIYPLTWPIAVLHLMLGAATVSFTMTAARRWGLPTIGVAIAGLVVALDPLLVSQSRSIMTETLAAALLAWALAASGKDGWPGVIETAIAFGFAALCRPSLLACAGVAILIAAISRSDTWRPRLARAGVSVAILGAILSPWAIRNRLTIGEFVWTTTHGGYTLALANNEEYYRDVLHGNHGEIWSDESREGWSRTIAIETDGLTEPEADRAIASRTWALIRSHPRDFLRASLARIGRFWAVSPSSMVYGVKVRVASATWTIPVFALALLGLSRRDGWTGPGGVAIAMIVGLSCVHLVYWTDMRMRAPLTPAIALMAGAGFWSLKRICEKFRNPANVALSAGRGSDRVKGAALGGPP